MRHLPLAVLLALVIAAPLGAASTGTYPNLEADKRLQKMITLSRPPETVGTLIQYLAKETGAEIAVEGDYLAQPVLFAMKDRRASEILTDIGLLTRGTWINRRGTLLLIEHPSMANAMRGIQGARRAGVAIRQLAGSLTPEQLAYLRAGHPLAWSQLPERQRSYLAAATAFTYWQNPEMYPSTLIGTRQGVEVRVITTNRGREELALCCPRATPHGLTPATPFMSLALR